MQIADQQTPEPQGSSPLLETPLRRRTRELLARFDLEPVKSLGQYFLTDAKLADDLAGAALAGAPDTVFEIGAGLGALTVPLARSGASVIAYEKDPKLATPLRELLAGFDNVELRIEDFLGADLDAPGQDRVAVIGNLPYCITTPILEMLFLRQPPLQTIVVTVQREVGERLCASPGTRAYGSLTVFAAYHLETVEMISGLPPAVFIPVPSVDSVALRLVPRKAAPPGVSSPDHFFVGLRAAFGYRRKTLGKALRTVPELGLDTAAAGSILAAAKIDPVRRGETLAFEEFVALGEALAEWEGGQ